MNYEEACEAIVTRAEARREIERHDKLGWSAFLMDVGDREAYRGSDVLDWLGY